MLLMIFLNSRAWLSASPCEWCPVALGGFRCFPSSGELFLQRQKAQSQKTAQLGTIRIKRSSASQKEKSKVRRSSSVSTATCTHTHTHTHTGKKGKTKNSSSRVSILSQTQVCCLVAVQHKCTKAKRQPWHLINSQLIQYAICQAHS